MEWVRSREQVLTAPTGPTAPARSGAEVPKFVLVDSNNRVRELTDPLKLQLGAGVKPLTHNLFKSEPAYPGAHAHADAVMEDTGMSAAELEEQRQLEQQLQVQKEEMCFVAPHARPSHTTGGSQYMKPELHRSAYQQQHAYTYAGTSTSQFPHSSSQTPPTMPPVSPFAGMALSAPGTSSSGSRSSTKLHNPFGLATTVESSPRLPSLNSLRSSPATHLKPLGIASRPPPLSLRSFSDVSTLSSSSQSSQSVSPSPSPHDQHPNQRHRHAPLRSLSNSSLSSQASSSSGMRYSQSLPGVSYLQDRRRSRPSFDSNDHVALSDEDGDSGMRLLSSSVGRSAGSSDAMTAAASQMAALSTSNPSSSGANPRSGRVCRYANCSNIARSRGLCRTHGGGKRCSHPNCNKSAQANRKCIAHGGGTPCSFGDCEKTAQSRGLCKAHGGGARCKHPDCPKSSQSKGLCRGHGGGIKCKADGCEKWVQKNGYCIKHGRERAMTS